MEEGFQRRFFARVSQPYIKFLIDRKILFWKSEEEVPRIADLIAERR
jgi:hypothetical protein